LSDVHGFADEYLFTVAGSRGICFLWTHSSIIFFALSWLEGYLWPLYW